MPPLKITLRPSTRAAKKWMVEFEEDGKKHKIHFGAAGSEDFTMHKDPERAIRYLARHRKNEDWSREGIDTAGFWSRWLLWNQTTLRDSIAEIERMFRVDIKKAK